MLIPCVLLYNFFLQVTGRMEIRAGSPALLSPSDERGINGTKCSLLYCHASKNFLVHAIFPLSSGQPVPIDKKNTKNHMHCSIWFLSTQLFVARAERKTSLLIPSLTNLIPIIAHHNSKYRAAPLRKILTISRYASYFSLRLATIF